VWECGEGKTDTQTAVANIHFASAMLHVKCNNRAQYLNNEAPNLNCFKMTVNRHSGLQQLYIGAYILISFYSPQMVATINTTKYIIEND